jgi:CBS domain-containing protein
MEDKVLSLIKRGAVTCTEDTTVRQVAQIMVINRIGYCVVLNPKHEVLGIISLRSILKAFGADLDKLTAKDILIPETITITPSTPLKNAIDVMSKKKVDHLIVVSDKPGSHAIMGLLRAREVLQSMIRGQEVKS